MWIYKNFWTYENPCQINFICLKVSFFWYDYFWEMILTDLLIANLLFLKSFEKSWHMLSYWCLIKWHGKFAGYFVIYIEVNKNKSDNLRQNYKKFKSASDFSVFFADLYTFNYISSITNNWVAHCCFIIKDIFTCKLKLSFQAAMKWYFSIYNFCNNVKCFGGLSTEHQLLSDDKPLF